MVILNFNKKTEKFALFFNYMMLHDSRHLLAENLCMVVEIAFVTSNKQNFEIEKR